MMEEEASIAKLYEAFADVPKPFSIDFCSCCMSQLEIDDLLSVPVEQMNKKIAGKYAGNAIYTVGGNEEYQYFFPRLLELRLMDGGFWPDFEIILGKLHLASWRTWPKNQRETIIEILDQHFEVLLACSNEFDAFELEGLLCGIALSGIPLKPYLKKIESLEIRSIYAFFVDHMHEQISRENKIGGYWEDAPEGEKLIVGWTRDQRQQGFEIQTSNPS